MDHFEERAMRFSIQEHVNLFEWWRLHRGNLNYSGEQLNVL